MQPGATRVPARVAPKPRVTSVDSGIAAKPALRADSRELPAKFVREDRAPRYVKPIVGRETAAVVVPVATGRLYERMGELIGRPISGEGDLVHLTIKGLPVVAVDRLVKVLGIDAALVAPDTTLRRRNRDGQPLSADESERTLRLARITSLAENLFGNAERAHDWLRKPAAYLPDAMPIAPISLAATDAGARMIESLLLKVEHGLF
jgi:putative toxin-antitoxin system antitoxin component (TIGR02293 family)